MSDMVKQQILPAVQGYMAERSNNALSKKSLGITAMSYETGTLKELSEYTDKLYKATAELDKLTSKVPTSSKEKTACYFRDKVLSKMSEVRKYADALEVITAEEYWPFPTYKDLLYGVN